MHAFSQCMTNNAYVKPEADDCPETFEITQEAIKTGGEEIPDSSPVEYRTFSQKIKVPKGGVCLTEISVEKGDKNAGFSASEWKDDLFVSFTRLVDDAVYDDNTSQISYSNTFYWNREAKEGDLAGRVLVK